MTMTDTDVRERPAVRFQLLGALRAWLADEEITLGANKQQAVLAILLLNANKGVSMDRIIDAVWGDEPPHSGANVVHKYIAGLRRALEPERAPRAPGALLGRTTTGYVLRVESDQLDTTLFETLVRKGRTAHADGHAVDATAQLTEALALWRGEPLYGLRGPAFDTEPGPVRRRRHGALQRTQRRQSLRDHPGGQRILARRRQAAEHRDRWLCQPLRLGQAPGRARRGDHLHATVRVELGVG